MECCFRRDRIPRTYQLVFAQTLVYEDCTERLCSNCCFFIEKRTAVVIYACRTCFHLLLLILIAISVCYQMAYKISLCAGFLNSHFEFQIVSQAICICLGHGRAIVLCAFLQHLQMCGLPSHLVKFTVSLGKNGQQPTRGCWTASYFFKRFSITATELTL